VGISGVAWATFIAQGASSLFSAFILMRKIYSVKCKRYKAFSLSMLLKIAKVAVPSILQQSFISVGNLFIQNRLFLGYMTIYDIVSLRSAKAKVEVYL